MLQTGINCSQFLQIFALELWGKRGLAAKLRKLYNERIDIYKETADIVVPDMVTPEEEAQFILRSR